MLRYAMLVLFVVPFLLVSTSFSAQKYAPATNKVSPTVQKAAPAPQKAAPAARKVMPASPTKSPLNKGTSSPTTLRPQSARPAIPTVVKSATFQRQTAAQNWLKSIGYNWTLAQMQSRTHLSLQKYSIETAQLITDNNMVHLKQLPNLVQLRVHRGIGDAGVVHFAALKKLKIFNMPDSRLTNNGLSVIATFNNLENLVIPSHQGITDVGINKLMGLTGLKLLNLTRTGVTDACMPFIAQNSGLNRLFLSFTGITDAAIPTLSNLRNLNRLDIQGTAITQAGLAQLQAALPGTQIIYP